MTDPAHESDPINADAATAEGAETGHAPADEHPPEHPINLKLTDADFPKYWKSGSLKYDDFKPLAEGGTAALQTCVDRNLNRVVAYKSLHPHLADDEVETARFVREARVTAMIPHPGTVPLYEIGRDRSGHPYFTMKKLEGRDLRSILADLSARKHRTEDLYPLERLIDILISASQTVAYAHVQGVIHRDIKPANILVGEFGEVTVLDWGLAKIRGEPTPDAALPPKGKTGISLELTQPGRRFGTPLYMSPEQARGDHTDERTDVYALGIVLYEMLTGKPLVFGNQIDDVLKQILERPTPAPHEVSPHNNIPHELEAICLRCLAKAPEERYPSVSTFITDLQAFRDAVPEKVEAYAGRWTDPLRRVRRRYVVLITGLLGILAGMIWMYLLMQLR
ncbi:serine/threonine-protein kinase [Algisphaera agarilytica]|uniref:Serine/threonine-protein kinase n=1 Tax=Algisphaera agarilytica TaxID=1385975 RepID=A0A7X0H7Z3_9BACT|nr:serine/threonine-protein kinase [Algisphaera agarilytica]MBB6430939.1 serine/threonine-protein kinase [Algisphaera agarilytica]